MTKTPNLTELEKDVLVNGIGNSGFFDLDGIPDVWSNCIVDTCKVATKEQISGVVASLIKKGLAKSNNEGTSESTISLTPQGLEALG